MINCYKILLNVDSLPFSNGKYLKTEVISWVKLMQVFMIMKHVKKVVIVFQ